MVATPEFKAISLNEFLMHPVDDHEWIDSRRRGTL
jgi:hypothetical protein